MSVPVKVQSSTLYQSRPEYEKSSSISIEILNGKPPPTKRRKLNHRRPSSSNGSVSSERTVSTMRSQISDGEVTFDLNTNSNMAVSAVDVPAQVVMPPLEDAKLISVCDLFISSLALICKYYNHECSARKAVASKHGKLYRESGRISILILNLNEPSDCNFVDVIGDK